MIKNNLAVILAERGLKMIDVINGTGINKNTISSLVNNRASGIQYDTLDKLCDYLNITPGELLTRHIFEIDILTVDESENGIHFDIKLKINQDEHETIAAILYDSDPIAIAFTEDIASKLSILPHDKMNQYVIDKFYYYLRDNEPGIFEKLEKIMELSEETPN